MRFFNSGFCHESMPYICAPHKRQVVSNFMANLHMQIFTKFEKLFMYKMQKVTTNKNNNSSYSEACVLGHVQR